MRKERPDALYNLGSDDYDAACREVFIANTNGEAFTSRYSLNIKGNIVAMIDKLSSLLYEPDVVGVESTEANIRGEMGSRPVLITVSIQSHHYDEWGSPEDAGFQEMGEKDVRAFTVEVTGHRDDAAAIFSALEREYKNEKYAQIKWWYASKDRGVHYKQLFQPPLKTTLKPEFYPGMGDPITYLRAYLEDEAAVLLVAGNPGTGKTTLLRHLICDFKLSAHIVYDEELMKSDQVFQSFLFDKESDVLIIEDADTILTSREHDGNKLMARFLNVSDGLIKLPDKKLVFTTNVSDFGKIDSALVRPGRCFDLMHTRALNLPEAQAAAKAASLPIPAKGGEYTLAELFNQGRRPVKLRRAGF